MERGAPDRRRGTRSRAAAGRGQAVVLACLGCLALPALPAPEPSATESMERLIADVFGGRMGPPDVMAPRQVRYMGCGYVAPESARMAPPQESADVGLERMLDWLRLRLRRLGE